MVSGDTSAHSGDQSIAPNSKDSNPSSSDSVALTPNPGRVDSLKLPDSIHLKPSDSAIQPKSSDSTVAINNDTVPQGKKPEVSRRDSILTLKDTIEHKKGSLSPQKDSLGTRKDSLHVIKDSLTFKKDTLKVDSLKIDSTARTKYFKYTRKDVPVSSVYTKKPSKFFANPTQRKKVIEIDSTGTFVVLKEKVGDQLVKQPLKIPIDDYLNMKIRSRQREMWDDIVSKYEMKEGKKDLTNFIKDITDFEIPLPSVGVLSIFGTPKISLRIGGSVDIHGAWRNEVTEGVTASSLGNSRNEPDFRQQVQINVNGTIGDKLAISADWNTERTFEYENMLKIKYTGYEDEIVQSVEAGNVSLQTSGLVGGSEALFGVKANFKMGPLTLTALASQKKGEVKEKSVSGGSQSSEFTIRAYDYSRMNYFLDAAYADTVDKNDLDLFYKFYGNPTPTINQAYFVKDIEVWKSISQTLHDPNEKNGIAYINLEEKGEKDLYSDAKYRNESTQEVPGKIAKGRFIRLTQGTDYILHPETGYITFKTNIQDNDIVAVAYRRDYLASGAEDDRFFGEFKSQFDDYVKNLKASNPGKTINEDTIRIILKLIKPQNVQPQDTLAWALMLKNIYPLNTRNVKKDGFQLDIKYQPATGDPQSSFGSVRIINAFGLDIQDQSGNATPDGIFDFRPGITILPETGEIIFPKLQPFDRNFPANIPDADSLRFKDLYDVTLTTAKQNTLKDKFIITGKSTGEASSRYQIGFNIVENSVHVSLNGRELSAGIDYSVDYNVGEVTIRNESALAPGANLKISYEENDLFQIASKTLFGLRGMIDIDRTTKLGFSMLTLSQQTLSDKVRIGEEPLSNTIYGVDFSTSRNLPFLTTALDHIISTKEASSINLAGEFAMMNPNPNTKLSTVSSDNGNNVAYIDDFEGSKRIIPIGISYTGWKDISVPAYLDPSIETLADSIKLRNKAKAWWFNVLPSNVNVNSIWPLKKVATSDQAVTVLDFVFRPDLPGMYNHSSELTDKAKNWGGMMKLLSSTANNLLDENIEFIEFWMKLDNPPSGAEINIDLGKISEDVIPNGKLDTEDKNLNELIDEGEDIGLDGMTDADEIAHYGGTSDPNHDDFSFGRTGNYVPEDYMHINGTEGNAASTDVGRFPDTEDLNHNGTLDQVNSYFRYTVPLDTTSQNNPYIAGGGNNDSWYLVRIPLKDYKKQVGSPSLSVVDMLRIFVTGVTEPVHFRLAEFNLVGNQWQKLVKTDSLMGVSVVSVEDNPDYRSPGGVQREKDRTNPNQDVLKNEQSLKLEFLNLPVGQSREAVKYLSRPLDAFNYSQMKLFIHAPTSGSLPSSIAYYNVSDGDTNYNSDVYFRFGSDTNNYYEYRQPLREDVASDNWDEMAIVFKDLTALKQARDSINIEYQVPVAGRPGHYYVVRGSPSLTQIKYMSIGLTHRSNKDPKLNGPTSGDIWVDELRVIGADDTKGFAYNASASLKIADFVTLNVNYSHTDPFFHRLSDRFGSRVESNSWGFSADVDILKLIPLNPQENNLKVNYSRTESIGKPLYLPGTDVKVAEAKALTLSKMIADGTPEAEAKKIADAIETDAQTVSTSETWTIGSIKLKIPSNYWLIRDTWNSLTFGFNYNKSFSRNPTTLSNKAWVWNANMNYALNISPDYSFYPYVLPLIGPVFGIGNDYKTFRIYYLPQTLTYNITARRNRSYNVSREIGTTVSQSLVSRDFSTSRGLSSTWKMTENGFLNLTSSYSFDATSSLTYLETDANNNQRPESRIWKDILSGVFFGKDNSFKQTIDLRSAPKLPSFWDLNKYLTLTAGYGVTYQWQNTFSQPTLGRSVGFNNRTSLGLTLRLKGLLDPLFAESAPTAEEAAPPPSQERRVAMPENPDQDQNVTPGQGVPPGQNVPPGKNPQMAAQPQTPVMQPGDSTSHTPGLLPPGGQSLGTIDSLSVKTDTVAKKIKTPVYKTALIALKLLSRVVLADYENIAINFSNNNNYASSGIYGEGNGLKNFWGISYDANKGPSRLYMLGLSSDAGKRAPGGNLTDNFSQQNSIDFRTSKPLWEGARFEINWKVGWSISKSTSLTTDSLGQVAVTNQTSTGSISRSFFSLPPVFVFSFFKSGLKRVNDIYAAGPQDQASLSTAFQQGFESMPWLGRLGFLKNVANYIPRPNWHITWDGLEKYYGFKSFAKRISLDHAYQSDYTEGWKINPDGTQATQSQKITIGFQPLVGVNVSFNDLWTGQLSGSIKYSTRSGYDLGVTTKNITEDFQKEIGVTLNYAKSGFELPLFGIALKNDIEFSVSYSSTQSSSILYDMTQFTEAGVPQNGTKRTTLNPSVKYVISQRVTMSVFYKRSKTEPEGAARISPTTTNEAGLDIRISIQ